MKFTEINAAQQAAIAISKKKKAMKELKIVKPDADDTLGILRKDMPQIAKKHYKNLFTYLHKNGVTIQKVEVNPSELKSTQGEFSDHGVEKAMTNGKMAKPIIISADDYVLDGHHRWLAAKNGNFDSLNAFKLSVSAKEGYKLLVKFPKTTFKDIYTEEVMKISDLTVSDAGMAIAHSAGGGSKTDAPITVTKLPSGHVYVVNGYHRLVDALNAGKDTIEVDYVPFEKAEILWKQEREEDIKYGKQFNEAFDTKVDWKKEGSRYTAMIGDKKVVIDYDEMPIYTGDKHEMGVEVNFSVDGRYDVTGTGDANAVFGAVYNHIAQWVGKVKPEVFQFSASKRASDSRASLYARMVKRFASQLGYTHHKAASKSVSSQIGDTFILLRNDIAKQRDINEDVSPREQKQLEKKLKTLEKALRSIPFSDKRYDKTEAMIVQIKQKLGIKKPKSKTQPKNRSASSNPIKSNSSIDDFNEGDIVTFKLYGSDQTLTGLVEKITFNIRERKHGLWIRVPKRATVINNPLYALNNGAEMHYSHINGIYFEGSRYGVFYEDELGTYNINKIYVNNPNNFYDAVKKYLKIEVEGDWENRPKSSFSEAAGVGRVVKGVNTTVDVGPNEIIKQVKKYGNDVDRDGKPKKNLK